MTDGPAHGDSRGNRAAAADPLLGRVLAGTYRLDARLGRGAMGTVYRAHHLLLGDPYAVKVLHPELAEEDDLRRRFLQEARALGRFSHKNAVAVRHCAEEDGLVFLAMDLCRGETLEALLEREGALPEARAVALTLQALAALEEAHRVGIVHRDLKPANVMVEPGVAGAPEVARVLDFGLSRLLTEAQDGAAASRVSALGEVVGTVAYMSPEQALGEDLDARSDLFSLGVMLHEMVEGRHPFLGGTMASVITRLLDVDHVLADPTGTRRASAGLRRVLGHALQRDRAHRFPSAAAFAAALGDLVGGREVAPPPDPARAARARARTKRLALVLAGAVALAGGGAWVAHALSQGETQATDLSQARASGAQALAEGRWKDAVLAYEKVAQAPGATGEDRLALAEARIALGEPEAERDLTAAARELAADPRVDVAWGRYHHRLKGDPHKALEAFLRALSRDKRSVAARVARLDLYLDATHAKALDAKAERRFVLAALDVAALEGAGAAPAEVALAKSRLATVKSEQPGEDRERLLDEALAAAKQAADADPAWAAGPRQVGEVLSKQAGDLRNAARAEDSLRVTREWVAAEEDALRRLRARRAHRAQGGQEVAQLRRLLAARVHAGEGDTVVRDAQDLARLAPDDAATLEEVAQLLRTAGDFEKALPVYARLCEIGTDHRVQSDHAFCHQRIAVGHLLSGEREPGVAALRRAIAAYDEAVALAPSAPVVRAYRGETHAMLARWDAAGRAEHLAKARADLDEAATLARDNASERREALYRRAGLRLLSGDLDGARADIVEVVGDEPALNPAIHGRYARVLLAKAARAAEEGKPERALALRAEALDQCALAEERSGDMKGFARLLRAQVVLLGAPAGPGAEDLDAARAALAAAAEGQGLPEGDSRREAAVWRALVDGLGAAAPADAPFRAALTLRRAECARGSDMASAAFYEALAAAVEARGDRATAAEARTLASHMPPP